MSRGALADLMTLLQKFVTRSENDTPGRNGPAFLSSPFDQVDAKGDGGGGVCTHKAVSVNWGEPFLRPTL